MALCVMATSQIDKKVEHAETTLFYNANSVVIVNPDAYRSELNSGKCSLSKETCFDCNDARPLPVNNVINRATGYCDDASKDLVSRLQEGVRNSPAVDDYTKDDFLK